MINRFSMTTKLIGAFSMVAAIAVAIGLIGYKGLLLSLETQATISTVHLPAIDSLWSMKESQSAITRIERTMLLPTTTLAGIEEQKKMLAKAWEEGDKGLRAYDAIAKNAEEAAIWKETKAGWETWKAAQGKVVQSLGSGTAKEKETASILSTNSTRAVLRKSRGDLEKLIGSSRAGVAAATKQAERQSSLTKTFLLSTILLGVAAAIGLGIFISLMISRALNKVAAALQEGSTQVASASSQLSSSSQGLAEGSSEQAASLEETSSAMEEMSAMTKRNAENSGQAKSLADRAGVSVDKANVSMGTMTEAMQEISSMGEEVGKIIRTIDEIAFQTNLLALNAAVEAARAGEAGAGFAVVADEVRNLAQRAAGAAKNTSDLIEKTVKKIKDGTELVGRTNSDFQEVASAAKKVAELVAEISAASSEQSRGIAEVASAIGEMDKVTQRNAAGAEEIASASEEMSAQASSLHEVVLSLESIVSGTANSRTSVNVPAAAAASPKRTVQAGPRKTPSPAGKSPAAAAPVNKGGNGKHPGGNGKSHPGGYDPEKLIPLQEKGMEQF